MSVDVLVLSLLLVLAAAGVLVASVLAGEPQWAWISVGCSGLAGVLLLAERFRRKRASSGGARPRHALTRRARRRGKEEKSDAASEASTATMAPVARSEDSADVSTEAVGDARGEQPEVSAAGDGVTGASEAAAAASGAAVTETSTLPASGSGDTAEAADAADSAEPEPDDADVAEPESSDVEPDEEATDAADVVLVSEAEAQVVVIDERPRYHLESCAWLGSRETIPLPVREARELAFSPCARCEPDATLVQQLRGG